MKHLTYVLPAALLAIVMSTAAVSAQAYGPSPQGYGQGPGNDRDRGGWDNAPPDFREAQQRGFRDGVQGARRDFENHRQPNVNNRDEFRNPSFIAPPDRRDYRSGFRRGYEVAVHHIYGR